MEQFLVCEGLGQCGVGQRRLVAHVVRYEQSHSVEEQQQALDPVTLLGTPVRLVEVSHLVQHCVTVSAGRSWRCGHTRCLRLDVCLYCRS